MNILLLVVAQVTCCAASLESTVHQGSVKPRYVGVSAVQISERVVKVYRASDKGSVEILDDGGGPKPRWQAIGVSAPVGERKCVGITAVRIGERVVRVYRASDKGSVEILDDGGDPKTRWKAIGVSVPVGGRKCVGISAVRISQRVVRVYRTFDNGSVEILDDGGNPRATWQPSGGKGVGSL